MGDGHKRWLKRRRVDVVLQRSSSCEELHWSEARSEKSGEEGRTGSAWKQGGEGKGGVGRRPG
jgi:hypothetical protein